MCVSCGERPALVMKKTMRQRYERVVQVVKVVKLAHHSLCARCYRDLQKRHAGERDMSTDAIDSVALAECVSQWIGKHADHPYWQMYTDEFTELIDLHNIVSPPEQLFACVWCHIIEHIGVRLEPQVKVGNYRIDFVIRPIEHFDNGKFSSELVDAFSKVLPSYAIEIDGFPYHDKTPEQAERDKRRDRFIQSQGYTVLRFAAREVLREPRLCVGEVHLRLMQDIESIYSRLSFK
jgi:very-short-patch-repair endonuclease